jgi:hypothetical protein
MSLHAELSLSFGLLTAASACLFLAAALTLGGVAWGKARDFSAWLTWRRLTAQMRRDERNALEGLDWDRQQQVVLATADRLAYGRHEGPAETEPDLYRLPVRQS